VYPERELTEDEADLIEAIKSGYAL